MQPLWRLHLDYNMNEQIIAKLVKQAGISRSMKECFEKNWNDIDRESPIGWYICTQARFENFIELIVRECVAICQDVDGEDSIEAKSGRQDCAVEIREHFGVQE